jgi:hypothetical protein
MSRAHALSSLALALSLSLTACKCGQEQPSETPSGSPTVSQVCDHFVGLIVAELGPTDAATLAATKEQCMVSLGEEQRARGPESWELIARCVLEARGKSDIDRCDQLYPGPERPNSREEEACIYMISMIVIETGSADVVSDAELEGMMGECLIAFDEDRRDMSRASYEEMLDCILAAQSAAEMEQCG